jgi:hypothetical protein
MTDAHSTADRLGGQFGFEVFQFAQAFHSADALIIYNGYASRVVTFNAVKSCNQYFNSVFVANVSDYSGHMLLLSAIVLDNGMPPFQAGSID